jgi:dipeptidyl aminopeptidase/acylaminoacyl peptidase
MSSRPGLFASLPLSVQDRIDEVCSRFEQAWKDGQRPRPEDSPCEIAPEYRSALLHELLTIELMYRQQLGEQWSAEEYRQRFPEAMDWLGDLLAVIPPLPPRSTVRELGAPAESTETPPVLEGYTFSGQKLGSGGMGVVWLGRDTRLNRDVAVKVMQARLADQPHLVRRFVEEAQLTSQLQHPGIPPVHELGELADGRPYFCMKVVKGHTLTELLAHRVSPAEELPRYLHIFEQVCQALAYAYSKGVIHRDLKPSNVMVGPFGEVLVMDWGLGKILSERLARGQSQQRPATIPESVIETERMRDAASATEAGAVLETSAYMPPEQARGEIEHLDRRSDVFGLGAILCEVLTGKPPYDWPKEEVKFRAQLGDMGLLHQRLDACGADGELIDLAKRCLSKQPEGRPANAETVAKAVASYQLQVQERLRRMEVERATAAVKTREAEAKAIAAAEREAREEAESLKTRAEAGERRAEEARRLAETLRERVERLYYANPIALAHREWERNNVLSAWRHLDSTRWDFRGWEYGYMHTLLTGSEQTFPASGVCFSADGKRLALLRSHTVEVWDMATARRLVTFTGHTRAVRGVCLSPDGKYLATGGDDRRVKVWDVERGQEVLTLSGHTGGVNSVCFSPDGKQLASASWDETVKVWDWQGRQQVLCLEGPTHGVRSVCFSPDGKYLAAGGDGWRVRVWDAERGQEVLTLSGHTGGVNSVCFSPDGKRLASAGKDQTVKVWDTVTGQYLHILTGHTGIVTDVSFSPDGKRLATASEDKIVKVWDAECGHEILTLEGHIDTVHSVCFSPDGTRLASGGSDHMVNVWDVRSPAILRT